MPSRLSWGIGRAATLLKTLLQYFGKSFEALPGVAYPGFRDNRNTLNTKTGYLKKMPLLPQPMATILFLGLGTSSDYAGLHTPSLGYASVCFVVTY